MIEAVDARNQSMESFHAVSHSHMKAMNDALSKNYSNALFFEDDVDFDFAAPSVIPIALKELPSDWEFLSLYCDPGVNCNGTDVSHHLYQINPEPRPHLYTVAIALSRQGIQKVLNNLKQRWKNIPIDVMEGDMIVNKELNAYMFKQPLAVIDQ